MTAERSTRFEVVGDTAASMGSRPAQDSLKSLASKPVTEKEGLEPSIQAKSTPVRDGIPSVRARHE